VRGRPQYNLLHELSWLCCGFVATTSTTAFSMTSLVLSRPLAYSYQDLMNIELGFGKAFTGHDPKGQLDHILYHAALVIMSPADCGFR